MIQKHKKINFKQKNKISNFVQLLFITQYQTWD